MSSRDKLITRLFLVAAMLLPLTAVAAQPSTAAQSGAVPSNTATPHYSDATLRKFVAAFKDVGQIRERYTAKLQQTHSKAQAKSLQQEAGTKMVTAVKQNGLQVQAYNQIAQDAQKNKQLRQRIFKLAGVDKQQQ